MTWTTHGAIAMAAWVAGSDGSAIVASIGTEGLWLHRRAPTWSQYRALADGAITYANVEFPPEAAGDHAVAVYVDPVTRHPRGLFASIIDGAPSGEVEFVPGAIPSLDAQIVFAPDGEHGEILLWDGEQRAAYLVAFADGSFQPARQLRPELAFDAIPRLVYHPDGGILVLHVSRPPTDPAGEQPALLEPLADFAAE